MDLNKKEDVLKEIKRNGFRLSCEENFEKILKIM